MDGLERVLLADFPKGLMTRRFNRINAPQDAVVSGENVDLSEGIRTRDGSSICSDGSLPVGEVMASCQFRPPTNEKSFLVVQVKYIPQIFTPGEDYAGPQIAQHSAIWDPVGERMFVLAGGDPSVWQWTPDSGAGVWAQVPNSTFLGTTFGSTCAYDSVDGRVIGYGGSVITGSPKTDVWSFNCSTRTFAQLATTGTKPPMGFPGAIPAIFRPNGGAGQYIIASSASSSFGSPWITLWVLDLGTLVWTKITTGEALTNTARAMAVYYAAADELILYGTGDYPYSEIWKYAFGTDTWTAGASNSILTAFERPFMGSVVISGHKMISIWGDLDDNTQLAVTSRVGEIYDILLDSWSTIIIEGAPVGRFYHSVAITGTGQLLIFGGREVNPGGPNIGKLWLMASIPDAPVTRQNKLYASNDELPSASAAFTEIYDFGANAGVCTFAILNDRLIITEGINKPPLVWSGCMDDAASDWATLKACLVTIEGDNYYNAPEVNDKDPDTIADMGSITPAGHIDFCCDVPQVEKFYIEVETPNTGGGVAPIYDQQELLDEVAQVTQYDLKNTIASWVQDAGVAGHFLNGAAAAVTIGPGNTCPDVIVGTRVIFADNSIAYISGITGDGSGASGVTLTAATTTQVVTSIFGTDFADNKLTVSSTAVDVTATSYNRLSDLTSHVEYANQVSVRQVIKGSDISVTLTNVQVVLNTINSITSGLSSYGLILTGISIVPRSGSTANGTTTPTLLAFPGTGFTPWGAQAGALWIPKTGAIGSLNSATSNPTVFTLTAGTDCLLIMDFIDISRGGLTPKYRNVAALGTTAGHGGYYLCTGPGSTSQNAVSPVDLTSFGQVVAVSKILGTASSGAPQVIEVARTNSLSQISIAGASGVSGIQVTETKLGTSAAWYALSFDSHATFWVFLSGVWKEIVKLDTVWKYLSAPSTWTAASTNNVDQALRQAFAVSANQMSGTALAAITAAQLVTTGGIVPNVTQALNLAMGLKADANNLLPTVASWSAGVNIASTAAVSGFKDGAYTAGSGWTDGTATAGVTLAKTGIIAYDGGTFTADYSVLNGVPGFWFRLNMNGTSAGTAITRILYKAPCQPLANIGDGQPDKPSGFIFVDDSKNLPQDFTEAVRDNTLTNFSSALIPMTTADKVYVGSPYQFGTAEMIPDANNNQVVSELSGEYWTGKEWAALVIVDGTASSDGKTLSGAGKITWKVPSDWKQNIPFDTFMSLAYWIRLSVSVALTATTAIDECRVYSVPPVLKKHRFAGVIDNRVVLGNRPDGPNQIDISRQFEEYGFVGSDSGSFNVGGQDAIQALVQAWQSLFVWQAERCIQVSQSGGSFAFQSVEAGRHVPVNSQVIVKAPIGGGDGDKYGLFFINRFDAFVSSGLHTDALRNTSRGQTLSDFLAWWGGSGTPRLDLNYLHLACGEYWPAKNWVVWSVPMIFEGSTEQTTNNCLVIYDLTQGCWYPPFILPVGVSALCLAYEYNANAPGKIGSPELLAGTYDGRILKLFGSELTDLGADIAWFAQTGQMNFARPGATLQLVAIHVVGKTAADDLLLEFFVDGEATAKDSIDLSALKDPTNEFALTFSPCDSAVQFNTIAVKFSGTGHTEIYCTELIYDRDPLYEQPGSM